MSDMVESISMPAHPQGVQLKLLDYKGNEW